MSPGAGTVVELGSIEVDVVGSVVVEVVLDVDDEPGTELVVDVGSCAAVAGPNATAADRQTTTATASPNRFIVSSSARWPW